jgi:hypothetical protein
MLAIILNEIEQKVSQLSHEDQLWLIERLVRRLREGSKNSNSAKPDCFDTQLAAMANDPEIRAELRQIDKEFAITEADGLARL